jgi:hypothetical protein
MPQAVHNDASSLRLDAKNRKNILAQLIEGRAYDDNLNKDSGQVRPRARDR